MNTVNPPAFSAPSSSDAGALPVLSAATSWPITALDGHTRLDHLGVMRAQGADAARFLHSQLTQDVALLPIHEARLAGYCSAKGRLLASFIVLKLATDDIVLLCDRSILAPTLKRLSMFVLRAACKLSDATAQFALFGLMGDSVARVAPDLSSRVGQTHSLDPATHLIRLSRVAVPTTARPPLERALCVQALTSADGGFGQAGHWRDDMPVLPLNVWHWLEVLSGIAPVTAPLVDVLVPQMLNYESLEGVNFKKGCYPGQEVVARSQFRGTLKRRTHLVVGTAALAVGQEVFHPSDSEQACGVVVAAATAPSALGLTPSPHHALIAVQTSALHDEVPLHVPAAHARLHVLPLPYPLLADI